MHDRIASKLHLGGPCGAAPPTHAQMHSLLQLLANALVELRMLGWSGEVQQAGDLANALHNLPTALLADSAYDWEDSLETLIGYEQRYANKTMFRYAETVGKIRTTPNDVIPF